MLDGARIFDEKTWALDAANDGRIAGVDVIGFIASFKAVVRSG